MVRRVRGWYVWDRLQDTVCETCERLAMATRR
ncbi:hypothetical protein H4W80_005956 [Nonomuraea angiospora]|uniref:Uncharacterized protein n=1 Tax=Nonomuraea angiospora TaxID=46172 RepID=A0ABR9M582_9ACTN|nr:hypothetical protein [Nonomuraea angiospora]